jgi:hypothetical protein
MNGEKRQAWKRKHRRDLVVWVVGPLVLSAAVFALSAAAFRLGLIGSVDSEEPRGSASERTVAEACGVEIEQAREFIAAVQARDPSKYLLSSSQTEIASTLTHLLNRNDDWDCEDIARIWGVEPIK